MPPIAFNFYRRQNPICWMKIAYWRNQKSPFESCKLDFPALRFAVLLHNTMKGILYRLILKNMALILKNMARMYHKGALGVGLE